MLNVINVRIIYIEEDKLYSWNKEKGEKGEKERGDIRFKLGFQVFQFQSQGDFLSQSYLII